MMKEKYNAFSYFSAITISPPPEKKKEKEKNKYILLKILLKQKDFRINDPNILWKFQMCFCSTLMKWYILFHLKSYISYEIFQFKVISYDWNL